MKKTDFILLAIGVGVLVVLGTLLPREWGATAPAVDVYEEAIEASTDFYTIEARYPVDPRDAAGATRTFVEYRVAEAREAWKDGGEIELAERELTARYPDRALPQYELNIGYKKYESQKLGTSTYVFSEYSFTGGAHGGTALTAFTFDSAGHVPLDAILDFENGKDVELTRELARKLQDVLGTDSNINTIYDGLGLSFIREDGSFDSEKCGCDGFFFPSNFQNAIVTDEGMTFMMGQYQVASYAVGMPEAHFTWAELSPYILPTFDLPLD